MSVVDAMLRRLVGEDAAQKIIEHPNLHVLSLPPGVVEDLVEGTVMVVPVGKLCDLCDLPEVNKFCQCEVETIVDDEGFTITTKRRTGSDLATTSVTYPDGHGGITTEHNAHD